jgi:NAD(P)H-hydrate epimerase
MIPILSSSALKSTDQHTLATQRLSNLQLVEKAARACVDWLHPRLQPHSKVVILCGHGNNGTDGLVIARQLLRLGHAVRAHRLPHHAPAADQDIAALMLPENTLIQWQQCKTSLIQADVVIDALLGFGTNRPADGTYAEYIHYLNGINHPFIISIDIPSGMPADLPFDDSWPVVQARTTLTLGCYKWNMLFQPEGNKLGNLVQIPLDLSWKYETDELLGWTLGPGELPAPLPRRAPFSHKGSHGHALLIAGSHGMLGAAQLAAFACLRSGAGKLTVAGPEALMAPLSMKLPEAMFIASGVHYWEKVPDLARYTAIGIGPGLGQNANSAKALEALLHEWHLPLVIDADGLNLLAAKPQLLEKLPAQTILSPHAGEFDRLFGKHPDWPSRLATARQVARHYPWVIVLKNTYTFVFHGADAPFVNTQSTAGLAKAGTGDVLTGILLGLLAQGYSVAEAAKLAVYWHGYAAILACETQSPVSLLAHEVSDHLGTALQKMSDYIRPQIA